VLAANADLSLLDSYDQDLDAAYEQAREHGDLLPLVETVRRWWFEADACRDPASQQQYLARVHAYRTNGPPQAGQRMTRQEVRARYGVWPVYQWELDDPAAQQLAGLSLAARAALAALLDAVVIVNPLEYQAPGWRTRQSHAPLRTLHFGPHQEGLVTFLA
jgi:hypothetical protein